MSNTFIRLQTALIFSLLSTFFYHLSAQKAGLEVNRTSAVDRNLSVSNVAVDANGRKWAANSKGVFQVKAIDYAIPRTIPAGQKSVLAYRGGNSDVTWSDVEFNALVKTECTVTAAWYDEETTMLWLGTDVAGLFQFKTDPKLELVQDYKTTNSKLKSNNITVIFQDKSNRLWVGTDQGLMYGPPGRWKAELKGLNIQRIREYGTVIYVLADDYISKAPGGDKWSDLVLDAKKLEGPITDFDIDQNGKMWIVSGVLTRFDLLADTYDVFSGPEYYTSEYGSTIAVDEEGAVWIGTNDKGLYQVDKASAMTLNATLDQPISCAGNGKDAVISARMTGGTPPYTYSWSGGLSGDNPKNVPAGTYSLTVSDSKGKSRTAEVAVSDPRMRIKARQKKPVSAPGQADGVGEVDIENNASGLLIQWDNGETQATALKLTAGTHTVSVTNPKGCSASTTVTISEKAPALAVSISQSTKINCAGEKTGLVIRVAGGKGPFKYAWSSPLITGDAPGAVQAGDYKLTVTDAAGATSTASLSIKQPETLAVTAAATAPATTGNADGKAQAQPSGGTAPYAYKWDNGETTASTSRLDAGQHSVTVTDANGCWVATLLTISENILPLSVRISEKNRINCAGEKTGLSAQITGGKGPFKYTWNDSSLSGESPANVQAGEYQLTVSDASGKTSTAALSLKQPEPLSVTATVTASASVGNADGKALAEPKGGTGGYSYKWDNGETTAAATKLAAGQHSVNVSDANGCSVVATSIAITENILPLAVRISEKTGIKCAGEKAALATQITGGKGPFKYAWSSPALSGDTPASVAAGDYQVTVTDATGTASTASLSIRQPETMTATAAVTASATAGNADGKATVEAKGGTGSYTYKWDNGETMASAVKLPPGPHSVSVTDANGCSQVATVAITENILPLLVNIGEKNRIKCAGEKTALTLKVTGGKPPYTYTWNNPAYTGDQATDLGPGDYGVTVTDAQGTSQTASVSIQSPAPLSAQLVRNIGATTERSNDGKAVLMVEGGTGKYNVAWDTKQSGLSVSKLALGKHSATVTDANGCTQTIDFETEKRVLPELTGNLENGQTIRMRLLNFAPDSSSLRPESLPLLDELFDFMMENGNAIIEVGGHTNNQPTEAFADQLSTERAKSVADYLFAKGIDPKRVVYKGYGKRLPLVPNTSPEGRRTNQRVEIKILKINN